MPRRREIGDISASCRIDIKPRGGNRARVDGSALAGQGLKAPRAQRAKLDEALPGSQRPDHGIQWAPTSIGRAGAGREHKGAFWPVLTRDASPTRVG